MASKGSNEGGLRLLRRYGNQGVEMVVAVFIGVFGGRKIDQWFDTRPIFLIFGFVFGAAAGFLNLYRLIASEKFSEEKMLHSKKSVEKQNGKKGDGN